jgi:hypothetical protein
MTPSLATATSLANRMGDESLLTRLARMRILPAGSSLSVHMKASVAANFSASFGTFAPIYPRESERTLMGALGSGTAPLLAPRRSSCLADRKPHLRVIAPTCLSRPPAGNSPRDACVGPISFLSDPRYHFILLCLPRGRPPM